jgi:hypothetical protein
VSQICGRAILKLMWEGNLTYEVDNNTLKMTGGAQYIPGFKKHFCSIPLLLKKGNTIKVHAEKLIVKNKNRGLILCPKHSDGLYYMR